MFESILWGGVLRVSQTVLQAAPTILVGLLVAGILQRLLGQEATRRLFGGRGWRSMLQAWGIGMLLPVCSLGVIPIVREMRRAGLPGGTIFAFALSAPLFNPLSFLYGLTLSEPSVIFAFGFCSLAVVTIVGLVWDWLFPNSAQAEPAPPPVPAGTKRLLSIVVYAAREITGPTLLYSVIALGGVWLLQAVLPLGSLQASMNHGKTLAPLTMTAVALPGYTSPVVAMSQLGMMFQHGNSVGAAFVLLTLGAGANLATLVWIGLNYGWRRGAAWLGLLLAVVLSLAFAIEKPLFPHDVEPVNHTHAFDTYCCPYSPLRSVVATIVWNDLAEHVEAHELVGGVFLAAVLALGLGLRALDRRWKVESWLEQQPAESAMSKWHNAPIPAPALGVIGLVGLLALSVAGCYEYYPTAPEAFHEMQVAKTEALSAALSCDEEVAKHWLEVWEAWIRRMEVGVYLRQAGVSEFQRMKSRVLCDKLELIEHAVADKDREKIRLLVAAAERSYVRMKAAYSPRN